MNTTPSAIPENDLSHQADELMAGINNTKLVPLLGASTIAHVVVILLLSVANIMMCVKYSTMDVTEAYKEDTQAIKEAQLAEKQRVIDEKDAARVAADAAAAAKDAASDKKNKKDKNGKELPKDLTDTKEAPDGPDEAGLGLDDLGID